MAKKKRQLEHEKLFFQQPTAIEAVLEAAHAITRRGGRVHGVVLFTAVPLSDKIQELTRGWGKLRGFKVSEGSPYLIELRRRGEDGKPLPASKGFLWQQKDSEVCYFLTCQPKDDFDFLFDQVHSYLQPAVCRLFLRTPQIEQILRDASASENRLGIRVRQYVARAEHQTSGRRIDTTVQYTNEDFGVMFRELQAKRMWLSLVRFDVIGPAPCTGRISRNCSFSCTFGFSSFFDRFVSRIAQAILQAKQMFQNRSRLSSPTRSSRPLKIIYRSGLFADRRNNHRLIAVLETCPNSALSVFHPNPYLHASLIDYHDGSSYSILVTTTSGILIVPERKATAQSLARICDHICDNFEEGEVVEFQPHEYRRENP
jgi:hypothetical protein